MNQADLGNGFLSIQFYRKFLSMQRTQCEKRRRVKANEKAVK